MGELRKVFWISDTSESIKNPAINTMSAKHGFIIDFKEFSKFLSTI